MADQISQAFRPYPFMERSIELDRDAQGILRIRSAIALGSVAPHIPFLFEQAAGGAADHLWLAQRSAADGDWTRLSYGAGKVQVDAVTQALLDLDRPGGTIVMLSGNSLEHAVLQLAAMQARMPFVAVTPAYSLLAKDFTKLRDMVDLVQPAVLFVQDGAQFERALSALDLSEVKAVVSVSNPVRLLQGVEWTQWLAMSPTSAVQESVARIQPETVAKYLFSSGSTGTPKAITMTQQMLAASVAMHGQTLNRKLVERPVQLTWLPWSHVAGGNGVFNNTIAATGTLYLDGGKPVPGAFEETLRNLREVSPTQFSSVPAGYVMLVDALESDTALAASFFRQLRTMSFSGARMPEYVYQRMQNLAQEHTGYNIPFVSGWGLTETSAAGTYVHWYAPAVGLIGLPQPGVEIKLLPLDDNRFEARIRGPVVTPGYLRNPQQTADAFDEEGFFKTGDALQFVDSSSVHEGLAFAGRVSEEFKLQTGIFVRVGALRVLALESAGGLLSDGVVAGADEPYVALLAWLNLEQVRARFQLTEQEPNLDATTLVRRQEVRDAIREAFVAHNLHHPASSMRIKRVLLLEEPPSLGAGEITDKGYVNQRAVLKRRAPEVARLFADAPGPDVIEIP